MKRKLHLLSFAIILLSFPGYSQIWTVANQIDMQYVQRPNINNNRLIIPDKYTMFKADTLGLLLMLKSAPPEFTEAARHGEKNILELPYPDGSIQKFRIANSPIIEAPFPMANIGMYTLTAQGIDDPYAYARLDWTPECGFHGMILSPNGNIFIDPYARYDKLHYISYYRSDYTSNKEYKCLGVQEIGQTQKENILSGATAGSCRGATLYTYKLAVSCTGEYAQAVTGKNQTIQPTRTEVLSHIVTTVNRVTGVYETELSVRLNLIANDSVLIYTDTLTDPYTGNNDANILISESRTNIPTVIGSANYDIGHTFSTGAGGLATKGQVCVNNFKAAGVTGQPNPTGDPFDIDFVAHEMGHQFGANHTFNNGTQGSCGGGNRNATTAVEPGGGTSIMAYAGICLSQDIQPHSDPYFHTISYDEIITYIETGNGKNCKVSTNTGNTPPQILSIQNNGVHIPKNTPFARTATAIDPDGDAVTYDWQQFDVGATATNWNSITTTNPIFRNRVPKISNERTFPDIRIILAGYPPNPISAMDSLKGEVRPNQSRTIKFRLVVRDGKGGVATGGSGCDMGFGLPDSIVVDGAAGPFLVTVPNGGESWMGGIIDTVKWDTANTYRGSSVNCDSVKILLSTDGGSTYPTTILASTPNDGLQAITIPNFGTDKTKCRIRVQAKGNIFFDISNSDFTITHNPMPVNFLWFNARLNGKDGLLEWSTVDEINNKGYEIYRSIGKPDNFKQIGFVTGLNNKLEHVYSFADPSIPLNTIVYYQLKQIDINGEYKKTDIRLIRTGNTIKAAWAILPNPAKDKILIVGGNTSDKITLQLMSVDGKKMIEKNWDGYGNNLYIDVNNLPKGIYMAKIIVGDNTYYQKLVKE